MADAPYPRALPAPGGPVTVIDDSLVERALVGSRESPRRRVILPLHAHDADHLHRMLNAAQPGTYFRPHRHLDPPKAESLLVVRGALVVLVFDDDGAVTRAEPLAAGTGRIGVDLAAGVFHGLVVTAPDTVLFEVKTGPYAPATDKAFPAWAPAEGSPEAPAYLAHLESLARAAADPTTPR